MSERTADMIKVFFTVLVLTILGMFALSCSYTAPSIATPDLVERVSNGHVICYYRAGLDRGYAKCCADCPMHGEQITGASK
jgi:hypothetical protein